MQRVPPETGDGEAAKKDRRLWLCFLPIMVSSFLSALDQTAIGTALPTIAAALEDSKAEYIWVGAAYAMSSCAFIPLSGGLANAFGRKPIMLLCIGFFAVGSALAGASQSMLMLIAARGIGGGGILSLTQILIADLVPLSERGLYQGIVSLVWAIASGIGPPIKRTWRWLFYLNLPLTGLAFVLVLLFLPVRRPDGFIGDKLRQVDWIGNVLYPWLSAPVLAPLVLGLLVLCLFVVYEVTICSNRCKYPTIPTDVVSNRTSLSGWVVFVGHSSVIYYLPVMFQSVFLASPLRSAVDYLPGSLLGAPAAFLAGFIVNASKKYRAMNWTGWAITIVAFGLFSTIREDSSTLKWVAYQVVGAIGLGILFSALIFPIMAPLPKTRTAAALALFSFTRAFFQTWGITLSSVILQNSLRRTLPPAVMDQLPSGFEYAAITTLADLPLDVTTRKQVQHAFAESMACIWLVMVGVSSIGLLISLFMEEVEMRDSVDERYALQGEKNVAVAKP
ncbi:iron permease [Mycena amicta]|nr:iron permease [Mycena amicta]